MATKGCPADVTLTQERIEVEAKKRLCGFKICCPDHRYYLVFRSREREKEDEGEKERIREREKDRDKKKE